MTKKEIDEKSLEKCSWFPICGGILIVVMMYYASKYLDFFSLFVASLAFIPYFLTLGGQVSIIRNRTLKCVCSLTLFIFYFFCFITEIRLYTHPHFHR